MTALDLEFWARFQMNEIWTHLIPVEIEMKAPRFTKPNMNDKTQRAVLSD